MKPKLITYIGLAGSTVTLLALLPTLTRVGGFGLFLKDVLTHGWVLVLLTVATGLVRTLPITTYVATGFTGFFAAFGFAAAIGRPIMSHLSGMPQFGSVVVMPLIEETLKVLPVLLVLVFALRRKDVRPSAADVMLLGAWSGAGFALHENGLYGRGGPYLGNALAPFFPVGGTNHAEGIAFHVFGHVVWTALLALGIGIALLYRHGKWSWLAVPIAFAVAAGEHAVGNAFTDDSIRIPIRTLRFALLGGWLGALLLILGTAFVVYFEWSLTSRRRVDQVLRQRFQAKLPPPPPSKIPGWLWPTPAESNRRGRMFALWQRRIPKPRPVQVAPLNPQQSGGLA
jgi:RsiW-degrading membrane proteinase PrsW (M82 family)